MSKIITSMDERIAKAKDRWTNSRRQIAGLLAPITELQASTADLVSWAEFAIIELKDRLTRSEIINKGLLDDNLALRDELLEVRREVEELRKGA
jgi:hypothetical protein